MDSSIRIERLDEKRIKDLQFLSNKMFGTKHSEKYFHDKYNTAYTGLLHASFVAYKGHEPIAFFGTIPQLFKHQNETLKTAQSCEYITLPKHQRQGIHRALFQRTMELLQSEKLPFVYALTGDDSHKAIIGTGFQVNDPCKTFTIPVKKLATDAIHRKLGSNLKKRYERVLQGYTCLKDNFPNPHLSAGHLGIDYSSNFFNYKTFTPNYLIQLKHGKAWVKPYTNLQIGALAFDDLSNLQQLLEELKKIARLLGCKSLLFIEEPDSELAHYLEKHYPPSIAWYPSLLDFDGQIPLSELRFNFGDFDTF